MLGPLDPIVPFVTAAWTDGIPDHATEVMRLCAMDWAFCGLGALHDPIVAGMVDYASHVGAGTSSVFFTSDVLVHGGAERLPARDAALINGTITHALDFDDTHFGHIGHVSTVVLPAALAMAEAQGRSFDEMITAARIGAEVAVRVGLWLGRSHYQAGWHQTATAGAYGAAMAAVCLSSKGPTPPVLTAALKNVAGMAGGLKAQFGSAMKPLNAGLAAANGVEAALLATSGPGLSGSPDVFAAVLATQAGEGNAEAFKGLGEHWLFDTVSHKYHACCHGTHAMLEALLSLDIKPEAQIRRIEVRTNPRWMTVCNKPAPTTWLEGKFSYAFLAAMTVQGQDTFDPGPELYFPLSDRTRAVMENVTVVADETVLETATLVRVTFEDGTELQAAHDLAAPEDLATRRSKLLGKGGKLLLPQIAKDVIAAIDTRDLDPFTKAIRQT